MAGSLIFGTDSFMHQSHVFSWRSFCIAESQVKYELFAMVYSCKGRCSQEKIVVLALHKMHFFNPRPFLATLLPVT